MDGAQTAESIAALVAGFLAGAQHNLSLALYDMRLADLPAETVLAAINGAADRGVQVRLIFNVDHAKAVPVPPPPAVDWELVKRMKVRRRAISGVPDLMHHKYVIRDAGSPAASVLTGSTNWTNDSWTREENVIVRFDSAELAGAYRHDFEELWTTRSVAASGHFTSPWMPLPGGFRIRPFFTPGRGQRLVHEMARSVGSARRRLRLCSPVITAGPVLGTLAEAVQRPGLDVAGVYDATQMAEVQLQWGRDPGTTWKMDAFRAIVGSRRFGGKVSTPYQKGSVHDFMHAKLLVADDFTYVGSYNLSHSGEENAENVVQVNSAAFADLCAGFVDRVAARYPPPASA